MNRWQEIWNKRSTEFKEELGLENLIRLDGFDSGAGAISADTWRAYVCGCADKLGLRASMSVFEVGCGSGAFSLPLHERGCLVAGIDYSAVLIAAAQKAMPASYWRVAAAKEMNIGEQTYDAVISNSVFHYFPTEAYAQRVLEQMLSAARHVVGILDVPDKRLAGAAEEHRRVSLGNGEYERRYAGLRHLALTDEWFTDRLPLGWDIETTPQDIAGYGNNDYRFNVFIKRLQ